MSALGKVAGEIGLTHADEDHIAVTQQTRGVDDHQFGG